jgi:CubicO group peptidase (beta-lactamase class C family)
MNRLSSSGLEMLHRTMAGHVASGAVPGLVTLISRGGEVHVDAMGVTATGAPDAVRRDTLFRVSSMTKPVIAAAALTLVDEGKLQLDEAVDRLLPELASRRVLKRIDGPLDETVPAARAITVRDLLTFRMGFGLIMGPQDRYPIQKAAEALALSAFGPPQPRTPPPPDEWIRRFATLPLMFQPGATWSYNTALEVLSVLVARASGLPLETFLRQRLFQPLGMTDTSFHVPSDRRHRLATSYAVDPGTGALQVYDPPDGQWSAPPAFPSGAGGLVSTADDFLALGRMLLGRGTFGKQRILSPATVEAMTTDQLTPEQKAASADFSPGFWDCRGWGLGVCVTTRRDEIAGPPGCFGWDGGMGTSWWVDPTHDLVGILMTQRMAFPLRSPVYLDFWRGVHQAVG